MHEDITRGYKVLTHHFCSPLQRGDPVWDGDILPHSLPLVALDTSSNEYGAGWNYCASIEEAFQITGLWPTGRPVTVFEVQAGADAIDWEGKRRSSTLTLLRQCSIETEIMPAIHQFLTVFTPYQEVMGHEQCAWFQALSRPTCDSKAVERALQEALTIRDLPWTLQQFSGAWNARDLSGTWDAKAVRLAREAWAVRDAWAARTATAAWAAWEAWAAWDAWAALTIAFARLRQWIAGDPWQYTSGIRDAYAHGLEVAMPVGDHVLGWAMVTEP